MNKKILGIGNAIVDVLAKVDDEFLKKNNLIKGSMKLINKSEFEVLKKNIKIEKVVAGGSVANTMAGIAYLQGNPSFIGKINSDNLGDLYKKSLKDINVKFSYVEKNEDTPTGASIILITPDSERTMCTYLGISSHLSENDINENNIIGYELIFLEGYLWDKGISEKMFKHAITIAKKNKVKIAMSLSDIFCVTRHKQDFYNLLKNDLDILIGNENEINELANKKNLLDSVNQLKELNKQGTTIIYTSHHLEEAENFCTDIAIIDYGKILIQGSPKNLIAQNTNAKNLEDVFLNLTKRNLRD
jgi:fructokinase